MTQIDDALIVENYHIITFTKYPVIDEKRVRELESFIEIMEGDDNE